MGLENLEVGLPGSGHWRRSGCAPSAEVDSTPKQSLILSALAVVEVLQIMLLLSMVLIANRENQTNKLTDHTQLVT